MSNSGPTPAAGSISPNQKGRMSDDPGDGARNATAPEKEGSGKGPEAAKFEQEGQGADRLAELGRQGSKQD